MSALMSIESLFKVLKYILIVSNVLIILGSLFIIISGRDLGEPQFKNHHGVLIFACLMVIILCLTGIIGAIKAHFGLILTYAVLMTLALILEVAELSSEDVMSFLISTFIVACAYAYAALIKRIERIELARRTFSHEAGKI